jgi:hypothetical protein
VHAHLPDPLEPHTPTRSYALPEEDPLRVIARELAASCGLLCVDEMHVADIADAMTLGRLLAALLADGCWAAFTVRACGGGGGARQGCGWGRDVLAS